MGAETVTVGLPVRNGDVLLDRAIDALARQTYGDLRIILSDNCSTDTTPAICQAWAERDPRIEYVRQPRPISALLNFRYVFRECRTPYFMWAAHDDLRSENYVARLVEALEAHPTASIAFGDLVNFSELETLDEQPVAPYDFVNTELSYRKRVAKALLGGGVELYGLIRAECLRSYHWSDIDYAPDAPISIHLAVRGDFIHVTDAVFYQWIPPELKTPAERARQESFRSLKPLRWVRLAWSCARAATAGAARSDRRRSRIATFAYLYARVRPVKLVAEVFASMPRDVQRVFRTLRRLSRRRRASAETTTWGEPTR